MLEYEDENAHSPGRFKKRRRPMSAASRIAAATLAQFQDAASSSSSSSPSSSSDADAPDASKRRQLNDVASTGPRSNRDEGVNPHRSGGFGAEEDEDAMAEDRVFLRELALEGRAERGGDVEFCDVDGGVSRRRPGDPFLDAEEDVDPAEDLDPDDLGAPLADFSAAGVAALLGFTPSAAVAAGTVTARPLDGVVSDGERPMTARRTASAAAAVDAERAAFLRGITKVELVIDSRLQSLRALGDLVPNVHELRFRHSARSHLSSFRDFGTTAFRSLRVLWVCNCALSSLSGVQHLHQLTELYASFNAITSLDPCADLLNLEVLDVEANQIALPPHVTWSDFVPDASEIDTPEVMRARVRDALHGVANLSELRTLTLSGNPLAFDVLRWEQAAIEANEAHGRGRLGGAATAIGAADPPTLRQMVFAAVPSLEIFDDAEADEHDRLDQQHQSAGGLKHSTSGTQHARGPRALLAAAGATTSGSNPPTPPPPSGPTTPTPNSGGPDGPDGLALSPNRRSTAPGGGAGSPSLRPPTAASRVADAQARLAALEEEFLVLRASVAKRPQDFNDAAAAASGATFFGATEALPPRPLSAMAAPTSARVGGAASVSGRVGSNATNSEATANSALWAFRPTTASSFLFDAAASRTFAKYATSTGASLGAPDGRIGARVGGFDVLERARAENAKSLRGGPTTSATDDSSGAVVRQRPSTARVGRSVEFSLPGAGANAGAPRARVPNTARVVDSSSLGRNSAADASSSPSAPASTAPVHSRGAPPAVASASAIATTSAHMTASPLPPKPVAAAASLAAAVAGPPPPPVASAAAAKPRLRAPLAVGAPSPAASAGPTPTALGGVASGVIRRPLAALRPLVAPAAAATAGSPSASAGISAPVTALPYGRPSSGGGLGAAGLGLRPPSSGLRQVLPTRAAPSRPTTGSLVTLDAGASQSPQRRVGGGGASHSRSSSGESIESSESSRRSSPRFVAAAPDASNEISARKEDGRRSGGSSRGTSSGSSSSGSSRSSSAASSSSSSDASPLQARYAGGRSDISGAAALPAATAIADALNPVDVRPASAISAAAVAAAVPSLVLRNGATEEEGPTSRTAAHPMPPAAVRASDLLASPVGESLFQHLRVDDDLLPGLPSSLLGGINDLEAEEEKADVLACGSAADDDGDADQTTAAENSNNWRERAERIQALLRTMPQVPAPMPRASAGSAAPLAGVAAAGAADSSGADTPSPLTMTPVESSRGGVDLSA